MKKALFIFILILTMIEFTGCGSKITTVNATVIDKNIQKAYTTFVVVSTGKVTTNTPIYHAEEYHLSVQYEDKKGDIIVSKDVYNKYQKSDKITVNLKESLDYKGKTSSFHFFVD